MPPTSVFFFKELSGKAPVLDWLDALLHENCKAHAYCLARIRLLAEMGHELRRPHADLLRDGIYELRARVGRVNYRILYFFHGRDVAVLAHGLTKGDRIPGSDLKRAIECKRLYEKNPTAHRYAEDLSNG